MIPWVQFFFVLIKVFQGISAFLMMKNTSLYFCCLPHIVIYSVSLARVPPDRLSLPHASGQASHRCSAGDS